MYDLGPDHADALAEIMNISIGHAASALSEMVGEQVSLSVPSASLLPIDKAIGEVEQRVGSKACAVRENFEGSISGDALLIFPEASSYKLVSRMVGDEADPEFFSELEEDALLEVGNVILTSCTVRFADVLGFDLGYSSLPNIIRGNCAGIFTANHYSDENVFLFIEVDFGIKAFDLNGIVLMVLSIPSADVVHRKLSRYLEGLECTE